MPSSPWITLLLLLIAAASIGAFLYTLAAKMAWEIGVHHLKVEAHRLRIEHAKRLALLRGDTIDESEINVDILTDEEAAIEMGHSPAQNEPRQAA